MFSSLQEIFACINFLTRAVKLKKNIVLFGGIMKGMFLFSTLVGSLICTSMYADRMQDKSMNDQTQNMDKLRHVVNFYEAYDNDGCNFGIRGDFLYMNYSTQVLDYAAVMSPTADLVEGKVYAPKPKAEFGCDIALTYTTPHDGPGYTFKAGWFYIRPKFTRSATASPLGLTHVDDDYTPTNATATNNGHININFIDLLIGKDYAWGDRFKMGPFGGLLGGFMYSKNTANIVAATGHNFGNSLTNGTLFQQDRYKGIGVKVGTAYDLKIWRGLSFMGNLSYNMLYGFTKANLNETANQGSVAVANSHYLNHHGRSFVDSTFGLAWGGAFSDDSMYADIHVQWRYQAFSDGWLQQQSKWDGNLMNNLPLYGQGLQAGLTFKF